MIFWRREAAIAAAPIPEIGRAKGAKRSGAAAAEVEDSSDGVALLLHGGAGGIRLLDENGAATGEACLLLARTTEAS